MDFRADLAPRLLRAIAMLALLMGLVDATHLLGVMSGAQSPIAILGPTGFAYLATFCLARLFSAVGIWIGASWGGVLLAGSTMIELVVSVMDRTDVEIDVIGYILRVLILAALATIVVLRFRSREVHD